MSFAEKNQNYLKKIKVVFPNNAQQAHPPEQDAKYGKKEGHYLAERENVRCFVNSVYNKTHEVDTMFLKTPKNVEYIVMFGCGSGDAISYALNSKNFPNLVSLTVVEPSAAWFSILMNETDMEKAWGETKGKMTVLVGFSSKDVGRMLADGLVVLERNYIAAHLSVRTLFLEYYSEMQEGIIEKLRNIPVFLKSNKNITFRQASNEFLNLSRPSYDFKDIKEIFKDKTILIVSAGPSLEKNIHLLEEAKKKAVVVAVGSAVTVLDARGIIPHFRMGLDPYADLHIFSKIKEEQPVPLIYCPSFCPEIVANYQGELIHTCSATSNALTLFLKNENREYDDIVSAGVSVANFAANVFCAQNIKKMVFIGQDMCMYGRRVYADNVEHEPYLKEKDKNKNGKNEEDKNMLALKDIYGNDVVAPRNYFMIKQYLEETIAQYSPQIEFINSTEGGLGLKGAVNTPLKEVLDKMSDDDIVSVINEYFEKTRRMDFRGDLYELKKSIDDIDKLNEENLKNMQKIKDIFLNDERFIQRDRYAKALKEAVKNEREMEKIKLYTEVVERSIKNFLELEYLRWGNNIKSPDEKIKFRSLIELKLITAQTIKGLTVIYKRDFGVVFSEKIKTKTFSLIVK